MYDEPYLESCCRSALHRLVLSGDAGRPAAGDGVKDARCLVRLAELGFARAEADGQMRPSEAGLARHRLEVLREAGDSAVSPSGR